ncbi:hypothetical protein L6452_08029 [Arctium lappa]|uniref:Uncharacterized protein n=1 Tax=Arctium lappa TaxID=4217 RepID=A0ACB9DG44_ARCLA|nr:hypothetical protein L6452_08029 [Arctium lappa]
MVVRPTAKEGKRYGGRIMEETRIENQGKKGKLYEETRSRGSLEEEYRVMKQGYKKSVNFFLEGGRIEIEASSWYRNDRACLIVVSAATSDSVFTIEFSQRTTVSRIFTVVVCFVSGDSSTGGDTRSALEDISFVL